MKSAANPPEPHPSEPHPSEPQDIDVTLLLDGGHQYSIVVSPDSPLLQQLFEATLDPDGLAAKEIFQIPIQRGHSSLCFRGDRLLGLITDPPVIIQSDAHASSTDSDDLDVEIELDGIIPSQYVHLDNFLSRAEHQRLTRYVVQREADFVPTTTSTGADDYRKSVVLHSFPEFSELMTRRIRAAMPNVLAKLNMSPFAPSQIEAQLTGHNDGNFYKVHNDNGSPDTATRELTYVYYFYQDPKQFSGGELVIYDSRVANNYYTQAETFHTIEPRNNSIVFFPSRYMHEVLPVACPSRKFADSRFTINGWVRR